jgi:hypothetical protein
MSGRLVPWQKGEIEYIFLRLFGGRKWKNEVKYLCGQESPHRRTVLRKIPGDKAWKQVADHDMNALNGWTGASLRRKVASKPLYRLLNRKKMVAVVEAEERVNSVHIEGLVSALCFFLCRERAPAMLTLSCTYSHYFSTHHNARLC